MKKIRIYLGMTLVVLVMAMAVGCRRNDVSDESGSAGSTDSDRESSSADRESGSADRESGGTDRETDGGLTGTMGDDISQGIGDVGNDLSDAIDDVGNGISDAVDDMVGDESGAAGGDGQTGSMENGGTGAGNVGGTTRRR